MASSDKIFLIGFMGSGKTTLGKRLAKKLEQSFFDLDKEIENSEDLSVNQIFEQYGEAYFRDLESKTLQKIIENNKSFVLSLGGGTPCNQRNMDLINGSGTSIYLKYNTGILASRLSGAKAERPLIKDLDEEQVKNFISDKLVEREPFYNQAQFTVEKNNVKVEDLMVLL